MRTNENVHGQRIDYELPTEETISEREIARCEYAYFQIEDALAIINKIQNERTNEEGEITDPLTTKEMNTILEVGISLERNLVVLKSLQKSLGGK